MESVENPVLEHLHALGAGQDNILRAVEESRARVNSLEFHVAGLRRDVALLHEDIAAIHARLDRHEDRLKHIEHRLLDLKAGDSRAV